MFGILRLERVEKLGILLQAVAYIGNRGLGIVGKNESGLLILHCHRCVQAGYEAPGKASIVGPEFQIEGFVPERECVVVVSDDGAFIGYGLNLLVVGAPDGFPESGLRVEVGGIGHLHSHGGRSQHRLPVEGYAIGQGAAAIDGNFDAAAGRKKRIRLWGCHRQQWQQKRGEKEKSFHNLLF